MASFEFSSMLNYQSMVTENTKKTKEKRCVLCFFSTSNVEHLKSLKYKGQNIAENAKPIDAHRCSICVVELHQDRVLQC